LLLYRIFNWLLLFFYSCSHGFLSSQNKLSLILSWELLTSVRFKPLLSRSKWLKNRTNRVFRKISK
jgi:hypothetical protein